MKVLLINSNRLKAPPVLPIGLCYVASAIKKEGHNVSVLDLCFSKNPSNDIKHYITEFQPEVIGIGLRNIDRCTIVNPEFLLETILRDVISPVKKMFKGPIIIGGTAVGINGAEILNYMDLEYAIKGDGELAMAEFLRRIERGESLSGIKGIIRRKNGEFIEENSPWRPDNINILPSPEVWKFIDIKPYRGFDLPIQVQTKRGCELTCTYCTYNTIEGKKYRLRDPGMVADEIESIVNETGIRHIEFTDSTFNAPLGHAKSVLKAIIERNLKLELGAMGIHPGNVDKELVRLMKTAGFREVGFSVESGSDTTLKTLGKSFRTKDIFHAALILHNAKIPVHWYLLFGAPEETKNTIEETFHTMNKAIGKWDIVSIGVGLRVYKGSPIARQLAVNNPKFSSDNFFKPYFLSLEGMEMDEFHKLVEMQALSRANYLLYHGGKEIPLLIQKIVPKIMKAVVPQQPVWRAFVLYRKIQQMFGINMLRKIMNRNDRKMKDRKPAI